jgi:hypothetical protein
MKIRSVGAELFRADGQTDMTKLIVAFRNYANALKKPLPPTALHYTYQCHSVETTA